MNNSAINNNILYIILLATLLFGCKSKTKVPSDIIPENKIVSLLVDMHIADATTNLIRIKQNKLNIKPEDYYYSVLSKHHTNKETFDKSIKYYSKNLEQYNKIYDEVLKRLSIIEGSLTEVKKKNDSTKVKK